jgi:hypothetical protein
MASVSDRVAPAPVVPEGVEQFVQERGLEAAFRHMLAKTPMLFPTARSVRVRLEPDREMADYWSLVFEVRVPLADALDRRAAKRRWADELAQVQPRPVVQSICLDLIREEE